ncbi:MAG: urease accessory protein UreF [bacterium]
MDTTIMNDTTIMSNVRLWQLISSTLPVGAYAYSGGLESAVEQDYVNDFKSCKTWLTGLLNESFSHNDLPLFLRLYDCWQNDDLQGVRHATRVLQSLRETQELLAEDRQTGAALQRLLIDLEVADADVLSQPSFASMFALACVRWQVLRSDGAQGLVWSWLENQVAAAIKLVPLGQTDGQRLLVALTPALQQAVMTADTLDESDIGRSLPGLSLLSSWHEIQYSRLFRS